MSEHHRDLVISFYPSKGQWTCVVHRVDADGMPIGADLLAVSGATKEEARDHAVATAADAAVRDALIAHRVR